MTAGALRGRARWVVHALGSAVLVAASLAGPVTTASAQAPGTGYTTVPIPGGGCQLATVDLGDGTVETLPAAPDADACARDLAFAPDGTLYGIIQLGDAGLRVNLTTYDLTTGEVTVLGTFTGSFSSSFLLESGGITFDAGGAMNVVMVTDEPACNPGGFFVCLYRVDPTTRVATLVGPPGPAGGSFDDKPLILLTADCGTTFWTTIYRPEDSENAKLATIDPATGTAADGPQTAIRDVQGIEYDRNTDVFYAIGTATDVPQSLYSVDTATGEITLVAQLSTALTVNDQALAIQGSCPQPPPPAPTLVAEPTFTG